MIIDSKIIDPNAIKVPQNAAEITQVKENLFTKDALREIKTRLKLPGHQIERISNIFIF